MSARISESEVAKLAVIELQRQGYETYEEVSLGYGGQRADIVGVRGAVVVVVETKVAFSTALVQQLSRWHNGATYVIGCAMGRINFVLQDYCRIKGYGLWQAQGLYESNDNYRGVEEIVAPRIFRSSNAYWLKKALVPEQKSGGEWAVAGSRAGAYFTPFAKTAKDLAAVVKQQPGITLKDALAQIKHHYSSSGTARSTLPRLIRLGVVAGVRLEESRPLKLYPATPNAQRAAS